MESFNHAESTLRRAGEFSAITEDILINTERHDYREEAAHWNDSDWYADRTESFPSLRSQLDRLTAFIKAVPGQEDIPDGERLDNRNLRIFIQNIKVSRDLLLAARFNQVPIEPMRDLADTLRDLGLDIHATRIMNIHDFCLGMRRLSRMTSCSYASTYEAAESIKLKTISEDLEMPVTKGAYIDSELYTCTDPDNRQYAHKVADGWWHYIEFGDDRNRELQGVDPFPTEAVDDLYDILPLKDISIDISDYSPKQIDSALSSFGYRRTGKEPVTITDCGGQEYTQEESVQLICEAIFEEHP